MRVAFFNSHNTWPSHTETELELMQLHLDKGDQVIQYFCQASLPTCDINLHHDLHRCIECIGKRRHGLRLLDGTIREIGIASILDSNSTASTDVPERFDSVEQLQAFKVDDFDVGFASCSSLVSALRNPSPDLNEHAELVNRLIRTALSIYFGLKKSLAEEKVDQLYVFNGRFAQVKAALRASNSLGIECIVHERGANKDKYKLIPNTIPHDLEYVKSSILAFWNSADRSHRDVLAAKFFQDRAAGKEQAWKSFVSAQEKGLLPQQFDSKKRNIVVFTSSEDEFVSISPDFKNHLFEDQLYGLQWLSGKLKDMEEVDLYIRLHPNMSSMDKRRYQQYLDLERLGTCVISADSSVSSYALLAACEKTLSFGSMMGVEATYWERPSILLGRMFYEHLDCVYCPSTASEALEMTLANLEPKKKVSGYPYAFYLSEFGERFQYYQARDLFSGTYRGEKLSVKPGFWLSFLKRSMEIPVISKIRGPINRWHRGRLMAKLQKN